MIPLKLANFESSQCAVLSHGSKISILAASGTTVLRPRVFSHNFISAELRGRKEHKNSDR